MKPALRDWRKTTPYRDVPTRAAVHATGVAYAAKHWVGRNGKSYACRADWESDVCRYHGAMTI